MNIKQKALIYLTYLLVYSDGEFDEDERSAIAYIREQENISDNEYQEMLISFQEMTERQIFENGVELVEECSNEEKEGIFVWLYKLSESDGMVHAKEVRFLMYSLRRTSLNFEVVKEAADKIPSIPPTA